MSGNLTVSELIFRITGEAYAQVVRYRQEMNYQIIRDQIERKGRAMIERYRGERRFGPISDLPAIGEAVPWYGDVGTGYSYTLRPQVQGCMLKIENVANGKSFFCSKALPPQEIHTPVGPVLKTFTDGTGKDSPRHVGYAFVEDEDAGELLLSITADLYPLLAAWSHYGKALRQYEFIFGPLTVGTLIEVRHVESGEGLDLTKDVAW